MTLAEIAENLGGVLEGDGTVLITGLAGLSDAGSGEVSFLSNPKYASVVSQTNASAVVVWMDWAGAAPCSIIRVADPDAAFAKLANMLTSGSVDFPKGVHSTAIVADDVKLGADVGIGPYCVIERGASIGDRTVLWAGCYVGQETLMGSDCMMYPHVSIREKTIIGDRVIIHNGAVIGSDGFGNYREKGVWKKIPQIGIVEIGNDVEIGANVTIDRARFGKTVISDYVKIDNLTQIAHNVRIGRNTAMAAQVGIAGSTVIGENVMIGGQAGLAGHLTVGDHSVIGAQAGVTKDVDPATFVSGYPAMPHKKATKIHAHLMRLPELKEKIKALEKRISELEKKEGAQA